jgi:hypothetical protein
VKNTVLIYLTLVAGALLVTTPWSIPWVVGHVAPSYRSPAVAGLIASAVVADWLLVIVAVLWWLTRLINWVVSRSGVSDKR